MEERSVGCCGAGWCELCVAPGLCSGCFLFSFHLSPTLRNAYFSVNKAKRRRQEEDLGVGDLLPFLLWRLPLTFQANVPVHLVCANRKPHGFKKQTVLTHHTFTHDSNGCRSNSSWWNRGLLWGSRVPTLQILQHSSGNIVQLKGLVCWYGTLHYSCFFYSEENSRSPSEMPCVSSFGVRCQPRWHANEPARRCTECTKKQLVSVWTLAWNLSFLPDVHTEAVQAALAKHKERKMAVPMPSKRRSLVVQTSMDAYTPPGEHLCVFYENLKNGSLCYYELIICLHR